MSVDFEPVRVGRRRTFEPAVAIAVVIVGALVVAVVKPWEMADSSRPSSPPAAIVAASPSPSPSISTPTGSPALEPDEVDFWKALVPVLGVHDEWGVQAVVADVSDTTPDGMPSKLAAPWSPGAPSPEGADVVLMPGYWPAYLLGMTFPADDAPSDARFWRVRHDGALEWIPAVLVPRGPAGSPRLFIRTDTEGPNPWDAGEYRIDVLHDERVERLMLSLADAIGYVPLPAPGSVSASGLVGPTDSDPSGVRSGLFATVDGAGVPVVAAPGRPLDETEAWLAARQPPADGAAPVVASTFLPRATGLGVMLTPHASVELAVLRRLAPSPLEPVPPARGGISGAQGRTPYVVFAAPDGEALAPGVYALSVSWSDQDGLHASTWHVELLPGPPLNLGP